LKWRILPPEATGIYYGEMPASAERQFVSVSRISSSKTAMLVNRNETEGKQLAKTACETAQ
jgi:hypothetical protein